MTATSHDLMRKAMADHAITSEELIDQIHRDIGGDRKRVAKVVARFVDGGPGSLAVLAGVIVLVVKQQQATQH